MIKEKITREEIVFVKKQFNKSLLYSLIIMPFILVILCLPIYFLCFFIGLFILNWHFDNLLSIYIISILGLVILNFLYGKIIINKKIENQKIYKITDTFVVQRKDSFSHTSDYGSDNNYFKLYLINEYDQRKGIYVDKEDYTKIEEDEIITITYFEITNIILKTIHNNQKMNNVRFFSRRKWRLPI